MAHQILTATATESDIFHPTADFVVTVHGSISGNVFLQVADKDAEGIVDSNTWINAGESFTDGERVRAYRASRGYAYRLNLANAGPIARWAHLTDAALGNVSGF